MELSKVYGEKQWKMTEIDNNGGKLTTDIEINILWIMDILWWDPKLSQAISNEHGLA